jgi:hypothetical protein
VVLDLHVRIYFGNLLLVFLNFQCLLLAELPPLITLLLKTIRIKSLLGQFLDLYLVAVPVEDTLLDLLEPAIVTRGTSTCSRPSCRSIARSPRLAAGRRSRGVRPCWSCSHRGGGRSWTWMAGRVLADVVGVSGLYDVPEVIALGDAAGQQTRPCSTLVKGVKAHIH